MHEDEGRADKNKREDSVGEEYNIYDIDIEDYPLPARIILRCLFKAWDLLVYGWYSIDIQRFSFWLLESANIQISLNLNVSASRIIWKIDQENVLKLNTLFQYRRSDFAINRLFPARFIFYKSIEIHINQYSSTVFCGS